MTNIFLPSPGGAANVAPSATNYFAIGTTNGANRTTENQLQTTWRTAGVFSNMYCRVSANTLTSSTTITYRVGAADGNQNIVITAGSTGEFSDSVNTDTVSGGNQVNYKMVTGASGTIITVRSLGIQFAPTSSGNTVNKLGCNGSIADTAAGVSYYNCIAGTLAKATTESDCQFKNKATATLQNMYVFVSANSVSVATVTSRINGSNGNLSISIPSATTGALEDTTHTDSIVSGDLVNTMVNGSVVTTFTITNIAVDYVTTTGLTHYVNGLSTGVTVNNTTSTNAFIAGNTTFNATASNQQMQFGIGITASNLELYVISSGLTAAWNFTYQINGSNGNQAISPGSGATGYFEDTTHTDVSTSTQELNYRIVTTTGTNAVIGAFGFLATYAQAAAIIYEPYISNWFF